MLARRRHIHRAYPHNPLKHSPKLRDRLSRRDNKPKLSYDHNLSFRQKSPASKGPAKRTPFFASMSMYVQTVALYAVWLCETDESRQTYPPFGQPSIEMSGAYTRNSSNLGSTSSLQIQRHSCRLCRLQSQPLAPGQTKMKAESKP